MRLLNAVVADMKFQYKHGFYLVYIVVTIMYLIALSLLPANIFNIALPLVVFSDPTALGLFFIGGIILLEKGQGVLMLLVVTPLQTKEYIMTKVISLAIVSVLVAFAISFFSNYNHVNWTLLLITTVLSSSIFTLLGILINASCHTVNQYLLRTVPYTILFILPCFALIGFPYAALFNIVPSVAALRLMLGVYHGIGLLEIVALCIYLIGVNYWLFKYAVYVFEKKTIYNE